MKKGTQRVPAVHVLAVVTRLQRPQTMEFTETMVDDSGVFAAEKSASTARTELVESSGCPYSVWKLDNFHHIRSPTKHSVSRSR